MKTTPRVRPNSCFALLTAALSAVAIVGGCATRPAPTERAATAGSSASRRAARAYKTAFPRLADNAISDKSYADPGYQALLARNDLVLLGFYKGWGTGPASMRAAVREIKARNPALLVGDYTLVESFYWELNHPESAAYRDAAIKLYSSVGPTGHGGTWTPNDWWGHHSTGGMPAPHPGYPRAAFINITDFVTPDANGDRYPQWFAKRSNAEFFAPAPEFDFWFSDNALYRPRGDLDWDRDGHDDPRGDPAVGAYYRHGMAEFWAEINRLQPGLPVMGNVDGRFDPAGHTDGFLREPEYRGKLQGAFFESAMGWTFSAERRWGWDRMMEAYHSLVEHTAAPHLVVLDVKATAKGRLLAPENERSGYGGGADYALLRYAFASALLDDGYFEVKNGNYSRAATVWFDEFDRAGAADTSWLGEAIDPPQTKAYQNGVYFRCFQHGAVLVNPRSNPGTSASNRSAADVTIPADRGLFKRFLGRQDPKTNNGESLPSDAHGVPHLTIAAGDGIVLMRQ